MATWVPAPASGMYAAKPFVIFIPSTPVIMTDVFKPAPAFVYLTNPTVGTAI